MAASTPTTSFLSALADSLGVPQSPAVRWAVAVGVPAAVWYLLSGWGRGGYDDDRTDFDGFLKRVEPVGSTGAAPAAAAARTSGSIDRFFRDAGQAAAEEEDSRNPVDFDSFLKKPRKAAAAAAAAPAAKPPAPPAERPRPEQAQVLVMFGTEYGFSKEVAEKLCSQLKATGKYWCVGLGRCAWMRRGRGAEGESGRGGEQHTCRVHGAWAWWCMTGSPSVVFTVVHKMITVSCAAGPGALHA